MSNKCVDLSANVGVYFKLFVTTVKGNYFNEST